MPPVHPTSWRVLAVVAVGGAAGALARWSVGEWLPSAEHSFPWATFAVNVAGSVLLALLPTIALVRRNPLLPPALGTGLLGGFTTLSAYSEEARALLAQGQSALAATYLVGTLAACLLGVAAADLLSSRPERAEFEAEEGDL